MEDDELLKILEGIPSEVEERRRAQVYYKTISSELKKLSKADVFGHNLKGVYLVSLVIEEGKDKTHPDYSLYVNGTNNRNLKVLIEVVVKKFIDCGQYAFHLYHEQLESEFSFLIENGLNENVDMDEYWCRLLFVGSTISGKKAYSFVVICFDKKGLETATLCADERHPFLDSLKSEWSFGKVNDIDSRKVCYNELFRRAASGSETFVYLYGDAFNALSALKYENESNKGRILALRETKEKKFAELQSNYEVLIYFKQPIRIEEDSYKKIRKLLEIVKNNLSLLLNGNGEVYAIGKMVQNPSCDYFQICFNGFLKWDLYKNNEIFLRFENMIPRIPEKRIGIDVNDIELLKRTFNLTDTSKYEKIIMEAVNQRHGTTVVFAENAKTEARRLKECGICIEPVDVSDGLLVEAATAIDGALICDADGICYSIGTILDGKTSRKSDSSRGARYNSVIRYIEQQKKKKKKTFIVVVSEDGYVNCFSSEDNER